MLANLLIKETEDTPSVYFDKNNNIFEISGRSLPEDASIFYKPVIEWLENYVKSPNINTVLKLHFEYFNSASARQLLNIFKVIETLSSQNYDVKVIWFYDNDDELMRYKGEELKSLTNLPFEITNQK